MSTSIIQLSGVLDKLYGKMRGDAENIIEYFQRKGRLSEGQERYVSIMIEKATKPKETAPTTQVANFHRIIEVFDTARKNEYKAPKLRLGDKDFKIVLSEAGNSSVNAGMIYVKVDGEYRGKISREGDWQVKGSDDPKLVSALSEFAMAPRETLKRFGFKTGVCAICNRKLTDKTSIANGIGPICAEGYGF